MKSEIDLLNVGAVCQRAALPYAQTLQAMHRDPDFPPPAVSQGNLKRWRGSEIEAWASKFKEKNLL